KLLARLRARKTRAAETALAFGVQLTDGYVFSEYPDGSTPLHPNLASGRFRNLARGTGVRLHDLRHAAVSNLLAAGVPVNDVAAHVGHASAKMTLDVYGHAIAGGRRAGEVL